MSITHSKVSAKANSPDSTLVSSTAWNTPLVSTDYIALKDRGCAGDGAGSDPS
jgi:hypothetical protein